MVNSNINENGLGNNVVGSPIYHKHSPLRMKKVALRDIQNENRGIGSDNPENCFDLGRQLGDPIKVSGTKIVPPEHLRSFAFYQFLGISGSREQGLGKRRVEDMTENNADGVNSKRHLQKHVGIPEEKPRQQDHESSYAPASSPIPLTSPSTFSPGNPPVPTFPGKFSNMLPSAHSRSLRFSPDHVASHVVDSKSNYDENRIARFVCLQKLLKLIDESNQSEYVQMLSCLSSTDLSRHAVELEKRSMQLSVEEAKEIQRMTALNILAKSPITVDSPLPSGDVQSKK